MSPSAFRGFSLHHALVLLAVTAGTAAPGLGQAPNQTVGKPIMLLYPEKLKLLLNWRQDGTEVQPVLDPKLPPLPGKSGTLASRFHPGKLLEVGPDGEFLDSIDRAALFRLDPSGTIVPAAAAETFEVRFFVGRRRYVTELPTILREAPSHVEITFSGTARATPDEGTVFNLDGAVVGFLRATDESGNFPTIELVGRDLDAQNRQVWRRLGFTLANRAVDELVSSGTFTIALDHARGVWTCYRGDQPLAKDVHLFTQEPRPIAACTAGQEDDLAILQSFSVLPNGPLKPPQPKSVDGYFLLPDGTRIPAP
jgi:hypothetical protein